MSDPTVIDVAAGSASRPGYSLLRLLGSLKFTLAGLGLLLAGVAAVYFAGWPPTWGVALPCLLLSLNLACTIAANAGFRRQKPLLGFHLALLVLLALVAVGRLTYLRGELEVAQGVPFDGTLNQAEAGPLHPWHLDRVNFVQDGFEVDYGPGLRRLGTRNRVRWQDGGAEHSAVIGDHHPMVVAGYRFYTTSNKGFAPVLAWRPDGGQPAAGVVHLPSYPMHQINQSRAWQLPGGPRLTTSLLIDQEVIDPDGNGSFRVPQAHRLALRVGDERFELRPGERRRVAGGTIEYLEMRVWMGYAVTYDATVPWLLLVAATAVLCLGWHFWNKYCARPWLPGGP